MCEAPRGPIKYYGFGIFKIREKTYKGIKKIYMLAGGTGLTPCFSII